MRIVCCFCGSRDTNEFIYYGAAAPTRPDTATPDAVQRFHEYVHMRSNVAGPHEEYWYHAYGCRSWLRVSRDTVTHAVHSVRPATEGT